MSILVTGGNGYVGYPLVLELLEKTNEQVISIDNNMRSQWVERTSGDKQHNIRWIPNRANLIEIYGNLTNPAFVNEILAVHKPSIIYHLASQPSMPYSQINAERASFTQNNNLFMFLNLLWGVKQNGLDTRIVVTTTTGVPGQLYRVIPEEPVINMAGSWYHVSRGFDSDNANLAARQWGLNILELRTSIVYGVQTKTMQPFGGFTRFDIDFYFGTVINRFVDMALRGEELTIYGQGLQTKPFISLEDTIRSLTNVLNYSVSGHEIMNQVAETISIVNLAKYIQKCTGCEIKHIPNPRKEKEDFEMSFENSKFLKLLDQEPILIEQGISDMVKALKEKNEMVIEQIANSEETY